MPKGKTNRFGVETRREFLKQGTVMAAGFAAGLGFAGTTPGNVAILLADEDPLAHTAPVRWAVEQLRAVLESRGLSSQLGSDLKRVPPNTACIVAGSGTSPGTARLLRGARVQFPNVPEALGLVPGLAGDRKFLLACGSDERGLVYALLELADRIRFAKDPLAELNPRKQTVQQPANKVRSIARLFASDVEDKAWFNDRSFWERYLTELATHRYNRFALMLGLGYDFPTDIRDSYFHFAYPFLLSVPGYEVRAAPLPDQERDQNLAMLRYISEETARRGLHFQLGIWTHAYKWIDSPQANYVIEGLSAETHANYCRDALQALLQACPAISGVTLRIHGESGIAEGSYDFWKTVFSGAARCGRRVELDLHAKGIDQPMIDLALTTGLPVKVSPKFWAEHMGLGYMQGAIRPIEMPPREAADQGFFSRSSGSRRFLRYGYGDLLKEDRAYEVLHRLWPGTQRLLLWGDPDLAADYGRAASFCGSAGVEWCEPLSFKGRKGSGLPGGRDAYGDVTLRPPGGDFEKYLYSYRVWGRRIYDPDCDPEEWRRCLRQNFGRAAAPVEMALGQASRILPLVTTAHCPSAANNNYWPEMYTNMAIVDEHRPHPYGDTLSPKRFGCVSSLDPEFFYRIDDFAEALLKDERSAKWSPAQVAAMLDKHAADAESALALAEAKAQRPLNAEFRRLAADVAIECGLGRFFAAKFRAGALFALYRQSGYAPALAQALKAYQAARAAWLRMSETGKSVYRSDVTFGPGDFQRGRWEDRLPALDADLADMEKAATTRNTASQLPAALLDRAIQSVWQAGSEPLRAMDPGFHVPAKSFQRARSLTIEVSPKTGALKFKSIVLRYRRVNQAELWQAMEMEPAGSRYRAVVPGEYTDSPYPLQYHFELREASGAAWFHPGLHQRWKGQPYFVVRQATAPQGA